MRNILYSFVIIGLLFSCGPKEKPVETTAVSSGLTEATFAEKIKGKQLKIEVSK